jgi:hypothetical protein
MHALPVAVNGHGKLQQDLDWFRELEWQMWQLAPHYPKFSALAHAVNEFQPALHRPERPNLPRRWRPMAAGQVISTAFIESLVNSPLRRRSCQEVFHAVDAPRRASAAPDPRLHAER